MESKFSSSNIENGENKSGQNHDEKLSAPVFSSLNKIKFFVASASAMITLFACKPMLPVNKSETVHLKDKTSASKKIKEKSLEKIIEIAFKCKLLIKEYKDIRLMLPYYIKMHENEPENPEWEIRIANSIMKLNEIINKLDKFMNEYPDLKLKLGAIKQKVAELLLKYSNSSIVKACLKK